MISIATTWPARAVISLILLSQTLLFPRNHILGCTCHPVRRKRPWDSMKSCFRQRRALLSVASPNHRPHTQCLCLGELKMEPRPCGHLQLPACRVKKGSVKEMVVVIAPMEDGLGRTKAGGREETIGHAYVKKQSWKGNRKAAAWEKSSVAGWGCFCDVKGQKAAAIAEEGSKEAKAPEQVYLLWEQTARGERSWQEKGAARLKEGGRGMEGGENRLVWNWSPLQP